MGVFKERRRSSSSEQEHRKLVEPFELFDFEDEDLDGLWEEGPKSQTAEKLRRNMSAKLVSSPRIRIDCNQC